MPEQLPSFLTPDDPEIVFNKKTPPDPRVRIRELEEQVTKLQEQLRGLEEEKEETNSQLEEWQDDKILIQTLREENEMLRNKRLDANRRRS